MLVQKQSHYFRPGWNLSVLKNPLDCSQRGTLPQEMIDESLRTERKEFLCHTFGPMVGLSYHGPDSNKPKMVSIVLQQVLKTFNPVRFGHSLEKGTHCVNGAIGLAKGYQTGQRTRGYQSRNLG